MENYKFNIGDTVLWKMEYISDQINGEWIYKKEILLFEIIGYNSKGWLPSYKVKAIGHNRKYSGFLMENAHIFFIKVDQKVAKVLYGV